MSYKNIKSPHTCLPQEPALTGEPNPRDDSMATGALPWLRHRPRPAAMGTLRLTQLPGPVLPAIDKVAN